MLYARGNEVVRGHSVADLWREVVRELPELAVHQAKAGLLDTYYIPTRYPDALPGGVPAEAYDLASAEGAAAAATTLLECCRALVRRGPASA